MRRKPTLVRKFRDRIEIYSPGPFPEKVTPELFVKGEENSIRRNKLIAGILYYSKDMETLAMGLKKIHDLCKAAGVKYEFKRNVYGFTVIFHRHCGEGWGWMGKEKAEKGKKLPPKKKQKARDLILESIKNDPGITKAKLAEAANISIYGVRYHIRKMTDEGIIQYVGSSKSGRWEVLRG